MAPNEKMDRVSEREETALVGVDESWPVLFRVSGILGFVLCKRRPSGHYQTSWLRLLPMVAITASLCWHLCTFPYSFTDVAYDAAADIASYTVNVTYIIQAFGIAIYRRREIGKLLRGLDGTQKPGRTWVSVAGTLVFLLHVALYLGINYLIGSWDSDTLFHWICMTLICPVLPSLLTLYLASLIHALIQVYKRTAEELGRVCSQGRSWTSSSLQLNKVLPGLNEHESCFPSQSTRQLRSSIHEYVTSIVQHCKKLSHLVNLYNQIFSSLVALTFLAFFAILLNSTYYVSISYGDWAMFYGGGLSYMFTEIGFFYLLCQRADALREAQSLVEEALLDLQQQPDTPTDERHRLLGLSLHLKNQPAHISIGSVGGLGTSTLVVMVNVALTYTAILFQYRPASKKEH